MISFEMVAMPPEEFEVEIKAEKDTLTQAQLQVLVEYNSSTGNFIWKANRGPILKGSICGYLTKAGRFQIKLRGCSYSAQELVWLYVTGSFPLGRIRHLDRDTQNNRFENLEEAFEDKELSREVLLSDVHYDPIAGIFTRLRAYHQFPIGSRIGFYNTNGYEQIWIRGHFYMSANLAFFYTTGGWPKEELDHVNGNPKDNRWENLREASREENAQNRVCPKHSSTGLKGVSFHKASQKYIARVGANGERVHLGTFDTPEEAKVVRDAYAKEHHGEFFHS